MKNLPVGMTEEKLVEILERVAGGLSRKFRFGYHTVEDIKQRGIELGLIAIDDRSYDSSMPLENFLWRHIHNRLCNDKRNKYERLDKPCLKCPWKAYDPDLLNSSSGCTKHCELKDCKPYLEWIKRNSQKKNLMGNAESLVEVTDRDSKEHYQDIVLIIEDQLPVEFREDYLRMKHGDKISRTRHAELTKAITELLEENKVDLSEING